MATKASAPTTAKMGASKTDGAPLLKQQQQQQQQQVEQESELSSPAENPVGGLQEQCQKRLWPMPVYTFECSNGDNPALRQFSCTVTLPAAGCGRGVGQSKRLAKRQAAAALLRQVLAAGGGPSTTPKPEQPTTPTARQKKQTAKAMAGQKARQRTQTPSPAAQKTQTQSQSPASIATSPPAAAAAASPLDEASFQRLRTSKRLQSAAKAGAEIGGIFRGVRNRKAGATLPPISPPCEGVANRASEQLTELGKAHRFGVVFLVDGAATGGCSHRSVVKLCTMPTIVAVGNGPDAAASREEACRAAMDYLCLLTKENPASAAAAPTKK